ncbi:DinB family protein [Aurantibacillus circumpalustris]|uniref:DinB family protein n=1 Tax=Aurantibacillus circumpalustris TaxID=3036359 RepID=UPI00295ADFB5|nr:DUF1572 family protein [Aurantibacillus circumpalustris]
MLIEILKNMFSRDLNKLKTEIESYKNEAILWEVDTNISNSAGNLCLHLIGNLNAFVGAELGKSGYVRQRELEFSTKNVPREELIKKIAETLLVVISTLDNLTEEDLKKDFPLKVFENKTSTEFFLIHLITHLSYHLGQINYHRRLLEK